MEPIITIKGISKKYNITHQRGGYVALRDVLTNTIKHPFRFLKSKTKKIIRRETKEEFWALKDINFTVEKGEAVGIIGANGAGKSTLLKILSKITPPTTGTIEYKGSMSSLLEVGTGFHPELTGRENIFLNGAILGMTGKEIAGKFNDIVEFSGVGKFLDMQVKRYSSGMSVRLAFAVAAHMEPDILIVDEVLAVGDAEFQKKCLGKMGEVTKEAGRTILFVSHNLPAIQSLCKRCILIEAGKIKMIGETKDVIATYLDNKANLSQTPLKDRKDRRGTGKVIFTKIETMPQKVTNRTDIKIRLHYFNKTNNTYKDTKVSVDIYDVKDFHLCNITNSVLNQSIKLRPGEGIIDLKIKNVNLESGEYHLNLFLAIDELNSEILDLVSDAAQITINNDNFYYTNKLPPINSPLLLDFKYENTK